MVDEHIYGSSGIHREIYINTPLLWKDSKNEESFIKNFGKVLQHETLHIEIYEVYKSLGIEHLEEFYAEAEEKIVRHITYTRSKYLR